MKHPFLYRKPLLLQLLSQLAGRHPHLAKGVKQFIRIIKMIKSFRQNEFLDSAPPPTASVRVARVACEGSMAFSPLYPGGRRRPTYFNSKKASNFDFPIQRVLPETNPTLSGKSAQSRGLLRNRSKNAAMGLVCYSRTPHA